MERNMSEERGMLFEQETLNEIRQCFAFVESDPFSGKRIYLENAGGTLTLKKVVQLVGDYTSFPDNAGRSNSTSRKIDQVIARHERALTYRMLHGDKNTPGMMKISNVAIAGEVHDLRLKDPVFLFSVKGKGSAELVTSFEKANIRVHNRVSDAYSRHTLQALGLEEGVRVSACHYTSPQEVDIFLNTLQRIAD